MNEEELDLGNLNPSILSLLIKEKQCYCVSKEKQESR